MSQVFEDALMEIQTDMIDLCLELTEEKVDRIFAYGLNDNGYQGFNAFFIHNGKIARPNDLGIPGGTIMEFLKIGLSDVQRLNNLCKEHGVTAPTEIRLTYDVNNGSFSANYQYVNFEEALPELLDNWIKEVESTLPTQNATTKKGFLERLFGKK